MNTVAVIIPTQFSHEKIVAAIESVLSQTFKDFEIILVQDGPARNVDVKTRTHALLDAQSKPWRLEKLASAMGASAARNKGAAATQAQFLAFLDDDDSWFPLKLEKQIEAFERDEAIAVVSCDYEIISESGAKQEVHFSRNNPVNTLDPLWMTNILGSCSFCMVRASQFAACHGFDARLPSAQDWDLWVRLAHRFGTPYIVPEILARYSDDQSQNSVGSARISRSASRRVRGYVRFLVKHRHLMPSTLWPFHAMRLVQFGCNDLYGVRAVTKVVGPRVRKLMRLLTGHQYVK